MDLSEMVLRTEMQQEQEQVSKEIMEDRKILIKAAIVRVMKMRNRLDNQQLFVEVSQQLISRFEPPASVFKICV
uniref:Cullin protein neddylation domain-containing protein n=1 Tax=Plectus sambesii TaxID=2011161 RepID=A0A914WUS1_9BILA